ncbi:hypothetical protein [Duganella aceris]|uniref:Uncharacterized protein n=1 Tax=Duganella aceris TaxID=2703883 RepID=A0ABX0FSB0_9BURK|nr:hypothetical protein [Duganella aceris]NGZ87516.1 hypothetical protein [Duganella aceris]
MVFLLYSSVLAAAPAHACCTGTDCPLVQCVATACTPSAMPAAAGLVAAVAPQAMRVAPIAESAVIPPQPAKEVWCPPD